MTPLSPQYRAETLRKLVDEEVDVLVVGGGVTGAGVALDAASRGLSTALVEARDFAAGTSSRSSKLIHGGLRYLEQLDFKLVREALKERGLLLQKLAPHLVRPVKFLVPLQHRVWERGYIGAGVTLYDTLGGARALPRHRHLSKRGAAKVAPGLADDALIGAIQYYDAQVDDARHTMTIARTAAEQGASVLTRTRVTSLLREGERVVGAKAIDRESGIEFEIRARTVVAATGVWSDDMAEAAGIPAPFTVRASKGIHLVVPREKIDLDTGLILRTEKSVLFVIPWGRHWIVGTTDTEWDLDREHPAASRADVDYVLEHLNAVLRTPVTHDDIEGVYAGLRPLLAAKATATTKLSREHAVARPVPGLVIVAGGKYTTYRVMAADAVDAAVEEVGRPAPPSWTDRLPIVGAEGYHELWEDRFGVAAKSGLPLTRVEHLLQRYGTRIWNLVALIEEDPSLREPITETSEYLRVEAVYAVSHEGALHLEDVLTRRTRISIEERDRGVAAAPVVAALMAPLLGWDAHRTDREVANYLARVEAERSAQEAPDDAAANATRLAAPALLPS
ncbi:glycerol-3-phosphate dehydrogenase/oxidase [Amycolatopsis vancoresmycina]|uniref:Glycerol-3-phosphate dehydrogenase n=1 Tax=Amycolatopsis vancoresmycina DSM 44592 TaxID=1292037 RepID=R1II67_9PSEU|nr:glycerol-3-phosphate dehydrogenase/oxidase [Amycolatopsis vancoresmycina]EOD70119.1 glycerol-3-phosphate dehydrogenase [Amycolatopsis vancoresmycina DSM 44592]